MFMSVTSKEKFLDGYPKTTNWWFIAASATEVASRQDSQA